MQLLMGNQIQQAPIRSMGIHKLKKGKVKTIPGCSIQDCLKLPIYNMRKRTKPYGIWSGQIVHLGNEFAWK